MVYNSVFKNEDKFKTYQQQYTFLYFKMKTNKEHLPYKSALITVFQSMKDSGIHHLITHTFQQLIRLTGYKINEDFVTNYVNISLFSNI